MCSFFVGRNADWTVDCMWVKRQDTWLGDTNNLVRALWVSMAATVLTTNLIFYEDVFCLLILNANVLQYCWKPRIFLHHFYRRANK